jgi:hypothetical protein
LLRTNHIMQNFINSISNGFSDDFKNHITQGNGSIVIRASKVLMIRN